ncbi:MAG: tRNA adenosine(34) deaminase TadA [Clostridia bacterium]|nr:tRNA adenosine(34) deaminase TadA [Clostridia bacterium]
MDCLCDEKWMRAALEQAILARDMGEIPIGAVVVRNGELIASAHNLCETEHTATAHAEILAVDRACRTLGTTRLSDCTLYVTLEPCPMCAGALIRARLGRVVFAAKDPRAGAFGSLINLNAYPLESHPACEHGLLAEESLTLLRDFFEKMRKKTK